jgi:hypothetical protein
MWLGFTFYAGMNPWITPEQLALRYGATILVTVSNQLWEQRDSANFNFADELKSGVLWGSGFFVIGFAWGTTCGYVLDWMGRIGGGISGTS